MKMIYVVSVSQLVIYSIFLMKAFDINGLNRSGEGSMLAGMMSLYWLISFLLVSAILITLGIGALIREYKKNKANNVSPAIPLVAWAFFVPGWIVQCVSLFVMVFG